LRQIILFGTLIYEIQNNSDIHSIYGLIVFNH